VLTSEDFPFVAGKHGVRFVAHDAPLHARPTSTERFVPWAQVAQLSLDEASLVLGDDVLHTFGSKRAARATVELLSKLSMADQQKRKKLLAEVHDARFDVEAVRARLAGWKRRRAVLGVADVALFLSLFGVLGAAMQGVELRLWMGLVTLACWLFALAATVFCVRALEKPLRPSGGALAIALVSPVSLMRSHDLVEPEWVADFHPSAVAAAVLPVGVARSFVEARLRAALHAVKLAGALEEGDVVEDDSLSRELHVERYRAVLKKLGGEATVAPKGVHCPRCLTEYTAAASGCDRCPGISLAV
jgi:hypothetical protein